MGYHAGSRRWQEAFDTRRLADRDPGFVRVLDERTVAFPSYDGNGMFLSAGNVLANPEVGLLFICFERRRRLRLEGTAQVSPDGPLPAP